MIETHYEISCSDGKFRMKPEDIGRMLAEVLNEKYITHLRMDGAGPLVIVQKKAAGNDQEDRVLRILERFGIRVSPQRTQQVRHIRCHQPAEDDEATRHLFERLGSDTSSVGLSFDWSTLDEKPNAGVNRRTAASSPVLWNELLCLMDERRKQ